MGIANKFSLLLTGLLAFTFSQTARAQSPAASPERFEVATIRPGNSDSARPAMEFLPGGGIRAVNATLRMLIQIAYGVRSDQITGGPAWADSDLFTVVAKPPQDDPAPSGTAQQELTRKRLRTLLSERFHLALKEQTSTASGYVLSVDGNGHKMTPANDPTPVQLRQVGRWQLRAEGVRMPSLVVFLGVHLKTTVEDHTGLDGGFTFNLNWTPADLQDAFTANARELPEDSLIPAVRQQLGLKLERKMVATEQVTIEHAEKPGEN
jgi:uncharacterized protein (TIGR03435 family)